MRGLIRMLAVANFLRHIVRNLTVGFVAKVQESFLQVGSYSECCPITNSTLFPICFHRYLMSVLDFSSLLSPGQS